MRRAAITHVRIGHDLHLRLFARVKGAARVAAQIRLVISSGNGESLREFSTSLEHR
jgi:hypothetical protein